MTAGDDSHYLKVAASLSDAGCTGRFMAVNIENFFLNVRISGDYYGTPIDQPFTLLRVLFSNLWPHRIPIDKYEKIKLIDSEGMQHSHLSYMYPCMQATKVSIANNRSVNYEFDQADDELEGFAKTRGWLWFPALPKSIYPHRLICKFWIFSPGSTSGRVKESETLEIAFDPKSIKIFSDSFCSDLRMLNNSS